MSLAERMESYPSLPSSRADIFPAGLLVLSEVMSYFNQTQIIHSYHNLRHDRHGTGDGRLGFAFFQSESGSGRFPHFLLELIYDFFGGKFHLNRDHLAFSA